MFKKDNIYYTQSFLICIISAGLYSWQKNNLESFSDSGENKKVYTDFVENNSNKAKVKVIAFTKLILVSVFLTGCGLFDNNQVYEYPDCEYPVFDMHNHLPNFGFEEGYYDWYREEKRPLLRNLNHLSIRFHEEYGEAFHDSVLAAYNIEALWPQSFDPRGQMPGFYRVKDLPADAYYTTYEDTTLDRLGNLPEIEYVLPAYYRNERSCDLRDTPVISFTLQDHYSNYQNQQIMDSLAIADRIEFRQLTPEAEWSRYRIYVTRETRTDPYTLYHHYYEQVPHFKSVSLNFAQTVRHLE